MALITPLKMLRRALLLLLLGQIVSAAIITPTAITPAVGTPIQNTSGHDEVFNIFGQANSASWRLTIVCDASATPTTTVVDANATSVGSNQSVPATFVVKAGYYYQINGATSASGYKYDFNGVTIGGGAELSSIRSLGSIYRNVSGQTMLLIVQLSSVTASSAIYADTSPTPTTLGWTQDTITTSGRQTIYTPVLDGEYYQVNCSGATVQSWREWLIPLAATKSSPARVAGTQYQNLTGEAQWSTYLINDSGLTGSDILKVGTVSASDIEADMSSAPGRTLTVSGFVGSNYYYKGYRDTGGETVTAYRQFVFSSTVVPIKIVQSVNP